jgi:hypothetical protein
MLQRGKANGDRADSETLAEEAGAALAKRYARIGRNAIPILVSAFALIFSGISLYQTVIKQAHLHLFVPDTIAYTRDPDGGFEVFAVPITISNSGARDGIVSSIKLEARNAVTGVRQTLEASYFAGPDYFTAKEDPNNNLRRPKTPFAPLSVSGRGSSTATVLFYARKHQDQPVVPGQGQYELLLTAGARPVEALGFLDGLWSSGIAPLRSVYELPPVSRLFEGRLYSGVSERMFRVE